jgi:hypothetical protein
MVGTKIGLFMYAQARSASAQAVFRDARPRLKLAQPVAQAKAAAAAQVQQTKMKNVMKTFRCGLS